MPGLPPIRSRAARRAATPLGVALGPACFALASACLSPDLLLGCKGEGASDRAGPSAADAQATQLWPALPRSPEAVAALAERMTRRAPPPAVGADDDVSPAEALAQAEAAGFTSLVSGDERVAARVDAWLRRPAAEGHDAYVLFGTHHDAAGQVEAFRELVGPSGARGFTHVVLEPLRADGAWAGLPRAAQRGDDATIASYVAGGDVAAFDALARAHEQHDYASWKFGYAPAVMDLLVVARATGFVARGCDMPDGILDATGLARPSDEARTLRELHCFLALRDALQHGRPAIDGARNPGARVAMLWGSAHVAPAGFRRWLDRDAVVLALHVLGRRAGPDAPEWALAAHLVLNDPILVPLAAGDAGAAGEDMALLLPDAHTGGDLDRVRVRSPLDAGAGVSTRVVVRATGPGVFRVGAQTAPVGAGDRAFDLAPGEYTYVYEAQGGLRMVGALRAPARGGVELSFDPKNRATRIVVDDPAE